MNRLAHRRRRFFYAFFRCLQKNPNLSLWSRLVRQFASLVCSGNPFYFSFKNEKIATNCFANSAFNLLFGNPCSKKCLIFLLSDNLKKHKKIRQERIQDGFLYLNLILIFTSFLAYLHPCGLHLHFLL